MFQTTNWFTYLGPGKLEYFHEPELRPFEDDSPLLFENSEVV